MAALALNGTRRAVLTDHLPGSLARDIALVIGSSAFVGLAAQLSFPLPNTPVPVTGQTFAVLLVGAALGPLRAVLGLALYLLAGGIGMPWFAGHAPRLRRPVVRLHHRIRRRRHRRRRTGPPRR